MGLRLRLLRLCGAALAAGASTLAVLPAVPAHAVAAAPAAAISGRVASAAPPVLVAAPRVDGVARYARTLTAVPARWNPTPRTVTYQWRRVGVPIPGATARTRKVSVADVGHRLTVVLTATSATQEQAVAIASAGTARHRVGVRRTVRYSVRTRGKVSTAALRNFRALAQQTFDDPRGWRGRGVRFVRVRSGGSFTLWLTPAAYLPGFSSVCSTEWSCRVGRHVVINQRRWNHASKSWKARGGSLRDYRHMVVNHETGHWLGRQHVGCPRRGAAAPVMMQQSKGLAGCRFNPWPTTSELRR